MNKTAKKDLQKDTPSFPAIKDAIPAGRPTGRAIEKGHGLAAHPFCLWQIRLVGSPRGNSSKDQAPKYSTKDQKMRRSAPPRALKQS
jgi:hypothetical protein